MNKEEKLNKLSNILNEYVGYMKMYQSVDVKTFTKTKTLVPKYIIGTDPYTNESMQTCVAVVEEPIQPTEFVCVKYHTPRPELRKQFDEIFFESIEFPVEDLQKRIEHYERKLKYVKEKVNKLP